MSAISSGSGSTSLRAGTGTQDAYSALSSGDFMKVMFSELARQDPLQPSQTKDLLQQIGTIRSIESNISLSDNLARVVQQNEVVSASSFVGQTIEGITESGATQSGVVQSVSVTRDGAVLNLVTGERIAMKNLKEVLGFQFGDGLDNTGDSGDGAPTP